MHRNARFFMFFTGVVLMTFLLARPANASKEGGLSLYSVILDSPGVDESGPVHVEMKRSDEGIEKLIVSAFGKTALGLALRAGVREPLGSLRAASKFILAHG